MFIIQNNNELYNFGQKYKKTHKNYKQRERRNAAPLTQGGIQKMNFRSEPNLYKLIFQSRKPEAEKFADWVKSEVLPAIFLQRRLYD